MNSYPHIGHGSRRVEELADDVGGGGDAEDDSAENFLPPGQQQHRVLPPTIVWAPLVSLYQTNGTFTFLPVMLAVGEVVTVVCGEKADTAVRSLAIHFSCLVLVSLWNTLNFVVVTRLKEKKSKGSNVVFTVWILKNRQGAIAVFIMGILVITQTLVKFIRADQSWGPRRGLCKDKMKRLLGNQLKTIAHCWDWKAQSFGL